MKKRLNMLRPPCSEQGIVLLEVLIAIGIFSFGLLGLVGLQATMIKSTSEAKYRSEAGAIAQKRVGELWTTSSAGLSTAGEPEPGTDISTSSGLPSGRRLTIRGDASCGGDLSCFMVIVRWQQPGGDLHNVTTTARIDPQ